MLMVMELTNHLYLVVTGGIEPVDNNSDNQTIDPVGDDDGDGILNEDDICSDTPENTPTDTKDVLISEIKFG